MTMTGTATGPVTPAGHGARATEAVRGPLRLARRRSAARKRHSVLLNVLMTVMLLYATLALSLNLVAGFAGIISIAHAAFYGVGAYASALLATRLGLPVWQAFIGAIVITGLFGVLFAWPVMRLRGHYVAMGTLGLGGVISIVFGGVILARPVVGLVAIGFLIGWYALLWGVLLVALSVRLRRFARRANTHTTSAGAV